MAINVDWSNKTINIPVSYLTQIQVTPIPIYDLDLNEFRLDLKYLEWQFAGMGFVKTHNHTAPVLIGGVELARVIEIVNNYTVTFEDGQYAVNLKGANSNVGDVVNVNQVSVRAANSAGLVTSQAIEFGEYEARVTVDPLNRTGNATAGTIYPIGTLRKPVNNIADAMVIVLARGFTEIFFISDYTFTTGDDISNMIVNGINATQTSLVIEAAAEVQNCEFRDMTISGILDGGSTVIDCSINDLVYFNGEIHHSRLNGKLTLDGGLSANIHGCYSGIPGLSTPEIDMGGTGQSLALRDYSGGILISNKTGPEPVSLDFVSGQVILDSTITDGTIVIRGNVQITDNSTGTAEIEMDSVQIPETAYNGEIYMDQLNGGSGTAYPWGTSTKPVKTNADAEAIAIRYNLKAFAIHGAWSSDRDYPGVQARGTGAIYTNIGILNGHDFSNTIVERMVLTGVVVGTNIQYEECVLSDLSGVDGLLQECGIAGTMVMGGDVSGRGTSFVDVPTTIDFGVATDYLLKMQITAGIVQLNNMSANNLSQLSFDNGSLIIDSSCTGGVIDLRGNVDITDNSSGAVTILDGTLGKNVWENDGLTDASTGSMGELLQYIEKITNNKVTSSGNIITIYDNDGLTIWKQYDLSDDGRVEV